ncbi:MFS transporter [Leifsonia kafniensis]|uniref:MFS transporter n=1 Tax=Leifsonia kafniensis TaxID=475957 RepID=A0ABP7JZP3_9MICO
MAATPRDSLGNESPLPFTPTAALEQEAEFIGSGHAAPAADGPNLSKRYQFLIYLAQFMLYIAVVVPGAFSLAIRVEQIAPEAKDAILPLAVGIPGLLSIIVIPLVGVWSDRTRSRFGRRRPWLIGGALISIVGTAMIGLTDSVEMLILGWAIAMIGYSAAGNLITIHLGDILPEEQRGKVMGTLGAINQIAPLVGIVIAGAVVSSPIALFLIPGALAMLGLLAFGLNMKDPQVTEVSKTSGIKAVLSGFWFNPRRYPNIAWVWISKAFIFLALSFSTIYGVYLIASRLGLDPAGVGGLIATAGLVSTVAGIGGAIGSGVLSDRLKTRKPFLIVSALLIGVGLIITGTTASVPQYLIGSIVTSFAIGIYGAVDQALALDVLPREENENGRFLAILALGTSIPQAVGPLVAGGILIAFGGDYLGVYLVGAAATVLAAIAIIPITVGRRATLSTTSTRSID